MTTQMHCPLADCPYSRAHYHVGDLEVVFTDNREEMWQTPEEERGLTSQFDFRAEAERINQTVPVTEEERASLNAALPPQTVENLSNELCVGAEPEQPVKTQDELLTALDELLDSALHDPECYIDANDTTCVCVIGKVRAALPPCGAVQKGHLGYYKCHRNAHPSSPDRHVF